MARQSASIVPASALRKCALIFEKACSIVLSWCLSTIASCWSSVWWPVAPA